MTDKDGKVLNTYTIAPKTGIGVNSKNQEVNLPQTGNNSAAGLLAAMGALAMIGFGFCLVKRSGMSRRKENAE